MKIGESVAPRLLSVRAGEQSEWMKLIPILLTLVIVAVSGWAEDTRVKAWGYLVLGSAYYEGKDDIPQDYKEAVKWFTKSAEEGDRRGQLFLGVCYYQGKGVTQDYKEAVKWYTKSAEQGDAGAQYRLGNCYYEGEGVTKDYKEAVKWWMMSANQGSAGAKKVLEKFKSK